MINKRVLRASFTILSLHLSVHLYLHICHIFSQYKQRHSPDASLPGRACFFFFLSDRLYNVTPRPHRWCCSRSLLFIGFFGNIHGKEKGDGENKIRRLFFIISLTQFPHKSYHHNVKQLVIAISVFIVRQQLILIATIHEFTIDVVWYKTNLTFVIIIFQFFISPVCSCQIGDEQGPATSSKDSSVTCRASCRVSHITLHMSRLMSRVTCRASCHVISPHIIYATAPWTLQFRAT